ncbi:MAG: hypothetical protein IPJ20_19095 [Flammeovirgaceae bacterium]|jgi:hypothetical protein|nr:hypothetical protein [Flammeovirgaceae bacterium]
MKASSITVHPNQENKSGQAPYASFTKRNYSTHEQIGFDGAEGKKRLKLQAYMNRMKKYFNKK